MGRAKKAVLAYSGGVDTSVCIPYLKNEWGVDEVITFAADLGQGPGLLQQRRGPAPPRRHQQGAHGERRQPGGQQPLPIRLEIRHRQRAAMGAQRGLL